MTDNKLKVLMIGPDPNEKGGIASVVNQYYEADLNQLIILKYIPTMKSGTKLFKFMYFIKCMMQYIGTIKNYEIIHIHMSSRGSFRRKKYFIKIAKIFDKKIIIHLHSGEFHQFYYNESNEKQKNVIRMTFSSANKVIALSEEWRDFLSEICDINKISILYNSVQLPEITDKNYDNEDILFLGRLSKEKGIDDLLDIFPQIINRNKNAHMYLAGDGDIDRYKTICFKKGIEKHVTFLGWVSGSEKQAYLAKCSIFVLSSYHEGMPMSLLEAMSHGCAVITTRVGGIPHVIENEKNGLLIDPGDRKALANCIITLLNNPSLKKTLGEAAYLTIYEKFNINKTNLRLIQLYQEAMED
ncbi:glycosyltransferase family 4 protein [Dehalobacterium formicoaceticum]|uniref:glycosyltransferase family 4 protein n=1 Tax=Dehalobacterium formicoaceticum TaxID=51515 RepID=UPI000B7E3E7D|nr:glycosyltransferase family 4 protein [Dehalobacterium formicoaceticum]